MSGRTTGRDAYRRFCIWAHWSMTTSTSSFAAGPLASARTRDMISGYSPFTTKSEARGATGVPMGVLPALLLVRA